MLLSVSVSYSTINCGRLSLPKKLPTETETETATARQAATRMILLLDDVSGLSHEDLSVSLAITGHNGALTLAPTVHTDNRETGTRGR